MKILIATMAAIVLAAGTAMAAGISSVLDFYNLMTNSVQLPSIVKDGAGWAFQEKNASGEIDVPDGYIQAAWSLAESHQVHTFGLFRKADRSPVLVYTCMEEGALYLSTHIAVYSFENGKLVDATSKALPPLDFKAFYDKDASFPYGESYMKKYCFLKYTVPQVGTVMTVELVIHDNDDPGPDMGDMTGVSEEERDRIYAERRKANSSMEWLSQNFRYVKINLSFNKAKGVFEPGRKE